MTLAALTDNSQQPTEQQLIAALSGHICRCTGYQGIRRAAKKLGSASLEVVSVGETL
jgi:carbon-monoxide dehydrogenase small subunit